MKITTIESLTQSQRESFTSIPDDIIKRLKKLTIEQQMDCIYVKQVDRKGIKVSVDYEPTINHLFEKCFNLSNWEIDELVVYDGVIVEISDRKNRRIRFGSAFSEKQEITHDNWDAHDHSVYSVTENIDFLFYLMIFRNHKYLTGSNQE